MLYIKLDARFVVPPPFIDSFVQSLNLVRFWMTSILVFRKTLGNHPNDV